MSNTNHELNEKLIRDALVNAENQLPHIPTRQRSSAPDIVRFNIMDNDGVIKLYFSPNYSRGMWTELASSFRISSFTPGEQRKLLEIQQRVFEEYRSRNFSSLYNIEELRGDFMAIASRDIAPRITRRKTRNLQTVRAGVPVTHIRSDRFNEMRNPDIEFDDEEAPETSSVERESFTEEQIKVVQPIKTQEQTDSTFLNTLQAGAKISDIVRKTGQNYTILRHVPEFLRQRRVITLASTSRSHREFVSPSYYRTFLREVILPDTSLDIPPPTGQIKQMEALRMIVSITLINASIPNYISESITYVDRSYMLLFIDEIPGEVYGMHDIQTKSFAVIDPTSYYKSPRRTYLNLRLDKTIQRWPPDRPLHELKTLTIRLTDQNGNLMNFGKDFYLLGDTPPGDIIPPFEEIGASYSTINTFDIKFTTSEPHALISNDEVIFFEVKSTHEFFDSAPAMPGDPVFYPSNYVYYNPFINRPDGYAVSVVDDVTFTVRIVVDDAEFYPYLTHLDRADLPEPPGARIQIVKIFRTFGGYFIKKKNQNVFVFEIIHLV